MKLVKRFDKNETYEHRYQLYVYYKEVLFSVLYFKSESELLTAVNILGDK